MTDLNYLFYKRSLKLGISMVFLLYYSLGLARKIEISARFINEQNEVQTNVLVNLIKAEDSSIVKSDWSSIEGIIKFENVDSQLYIIQIYSLGFEQAFFEVLPSRSSVWNQGDLKLKSISQLKELTITSTKSLIERTGEKTIVHVQNSILSEGSNVFETLQKSPGILIRSNETISLKGKEGIIFMIDGKVTPLTGDELIQYLKSIPSSNIDRIELISNPSSKYDAAGNAGIIDIRFIKNNRKGLNGNVSSNIGQSQYFKYGASTNLNYRLSNWNIFGSYNISRPIANASFNIHRNFFNSLQEVESAIEQHSMVKAPNQNQNPRIGIDYNYDSRSTIGIVWNGTFTNNRRNGISQTTLFSPTQQILGTTETNNDLSAKNSINFGNINFKHKFDTTGQELNIDLDKGYYNSRNAQNFNSNFSDQDHNPLAKDRLHTDQQGILSVKSIKIDYVLPFANRFKMEAGLKSSLVKTDNDIQFFKIQDGSSFLDTMHSNHFIYKENVNAVYVQGSKDYQTMGIQFGLRLEHTQTNGYQISIDSNFYRNYINLFPSFAWTKRLSQNHDIGVNYSRRIDRPTYRQLNPFAIFVDPYTYVVGDTNLLSVLSHHLGLSYTFRGMYTAEVSYERGNQVITDVFVQDDKTKVSYQIPANLQKLDFINFSISIPFSIKNWYQSSINGGLNWSQYQSAFQGGVLRQSSVAWDIQHQNSIVINSKGWTAEISEYFQSRMVWGLFTIRSLAQVNVGIQKTSANKKSTIKLSATDIFFTNHIAVLVKYQNMDFYTNRTWDSRTLTLSYSYRFGKMNPTKSNSRNSGIEDIKKRAV